MEPFNPTAAILGLLPISVTVLPLLGATLIPYTSPYLPIPTISNVSGTSYAMNSRPASPVQAILATSLLSLEQTRSDQYQHHWQTGISSLDKSLPPYLWTSGKLIGIIDDSEADLSTSDLQPVPLIAKLIVTHLSSIHSASSHNSKPPPGPALSATAIYILTSLSTPTTSPQTSALSPPLLSLALSKEASLPPSLLDSISLLQYFDFAGLADAVAEVSQTLFENTQPGHPPDQIRKEGSILVLDGLVPTLATLARTSGPVATNALLVPLLRSLSHLSRKNEDLLILLALAPEFLDALSFGSGGGSSGQEMSAFSCYADHRRERMRRGGQAWKGGHIDVRGLTTGSEQRGGGTSWKATARTDSSLTTVMNTLAAKLDELILVHTVEVDADGENGRDVVEVLVDRVAGGTGRWAVR